MKQSAVEPVLRSEALGRARASILQRKCACGQHAIGGECEECRKKDGSAAGYGSLQRKASTVISAHATPRFGSDFTRVPVHTPGERSEAWNGPDPDEKAPSPKESKKPTMESGQKTKNTPACTPPTGVRLVWSAEVEFPGYLTGGGICALMRLLPETDKVCHVNPNEELTATSDTTCPDSLFQRSLCHGDSEFPLGKRPTKGPCKALDPKSTEFSDRHTANLSGTSVLHDSKRNPKGLDTCKIICNQEYYIPGKDRVGLGHFLIESELRKGSKDGKNITYVKVTKKAKR